DLAVMVGLKKSVDANYQSMLARVTALRKKTIQQARKLDSVEMKAVQQINRRTPPPSRTKSSSS
ncbi:MAG: hypothetical protein N2C12_09540, partial [Planctomycetales bacterium]